MNINFHWGGLRFYLESKGTTLSQPHVRLVANIDDDDMFGNAGRASIIKSKIIYSLVM